MVDGQTFREYVANEKKKWKELNGAQKWKYFYDYYMVKTIVTVIILAAFVTFLVQVVLFGKRPLYAGYEVNVYANDAGEQFLTTDYLAYLGGNPNHQEVRLSECYIDFFSDDPIADTSSDQMVLSVQAESKKYQYMLMNSNALYSAKDMDIYADLEAVLSDEWYAKLKDRMIVMEIGGFRYPVAIDLGGTEFAKKYGFDDNDLYLAFNSFDADVDETNQFLDYILGDEFK